MNGSMETVLCQKEKGVHYFVGFIISPRYRKYTSKPYYLRFILFFYFMNVLFNTFLWAIVVKTKFNIL